MTTVITASAFKATRTRVLRILTDRPLSHGQWSNRWGPPPWAESNDERPSKHGKRENNAGSVMVVSRTVALQPRRTREQCSDSTRQCSVRTRPALGAAQGGTTGRADAVVRPPHSRRRDCPPITKPGQGRAIVAFLGERAIGCAFDGSLSVRTPRVTCDPFATCRSDLVQPVGQLRIQRSDDSGVARAGRHDTYGVESPFMDIKSMNEHEDTGRTRKQRPGVCHRCGRARPVSKVGRVDRKRLGTSFARFLTSASTSCSISSRPMRIEDLSKGQAQGPTSPPRGVTSRRRGDRSTVPLAGVPRRPSE